MSRKREHVPQDKRKRALYSCDRCKQKKRACKRFIDGKQQFDNVTRCENCVVTNSDCTTKIPRKKRTYYSVSETTLYQLKSSSLIIKAMFPESDPNNMDDIQNIADALFVKIPQLNECTTESSVAEKLEHKCESDESCMPECVNETNYAVTSNSNGSKLERINESSGENQIVLGSDKLFDALLKVGDFNEANPTGHKEFNSLNKLINHPSLPLSTGCSCSQSILLNLIPRSECQMYIDIFFSKVHESYFIFNESKFRIRHELLLDILRNKPLLTIYQFSCEEISVIYLVWILGRNCYFTKLLHSKEIPRTGLVPDSIIAKYLDLIKMSLSGAFFADTIHSIRMLYLMSLYESATGNSTWAWHLLSNCCLKSFGLGYHKSDVVSSFTEDDQEEIKIVWWSSFKLHMNNCIINGVLPNISLYDVDVELPKLKCMRDELFQDTYTQSIELFKIMFNVLKNREYLTKSRNPWCKENLKNVCEISMSLKHWETGLDYSIKYYKRPDPKRYQIKLHMQYYYCCISLVGPYLIAFALHPTPSFEIATCILDLFCDGVNFALQLLEVIEFSVDSGYFNGLLHYDLFYCYSALMILLLGFTITREKQVSKQSENHRLFAKLLVEKFEIDVNTMLEAILKIRKINNNYGLKTVGRMHEFSNNISTLLKYFNLDVDDLILVKEGKQKINLDCLKQDNKMTENLEAKTQSTVEISQDENDFFDFINFLDSGSEVNQIEFNDQLLLDWNKMFGPISGNCDHQF